MKIKKGDSVLIISGKDKGKTGKVLRVFPQKDRIVVEGVNFKKRHRRPRKGGEKGQIAILPAPVHVSNAKLICSSCGKATRIGYRVEGGRKYRICKKCHRET